MLGAELRGSRGEEGCGVFAIRLEADDGTTICRVQGDADAASASQLRETFSELTAETRVIIDFSGVSFIDSAGLGCLIAGARRIHDAGGEVVLCSARRAVHRLLHTVGMDRVLPIVETMHIAMCLLDGRTVTDGGAPSSTRTLPV
jgi:anti-sigma B factor antagonist